MLTQKARGFSLVELMVALAINAFLFIGLISIFVANMNHYNKVVDINRLNQQLEAALDLMGNEIRRAGYWANANADVGLDQNTNPFMTGVTDISTNVANNCILFSYDHNMDGAIPAIGSGYDDERYGFRLNGQIIQGRPPGAAFSCSASANSWENMTDPNSINVSNLTFTLTQSTIVTGPGTRGLTMRSVDITITGALTKDSSITKTLTQHIRIRNDKFIP